MKTFFYKLWSNKFIQGSTIFTTASFIVNLINYFFSILVARALGPTGFGEITALFSYTTIFSVPLLVMTMVIIQKIGSKGVQAKRFSQALEVWFLSKLKTRWYLIAFALCASPFVSRFTNLSLVSGYSLIPFILLSFVGTFYAALLQGLQAFGWISILNLISAALKLGGAIAVIIGVDGVGTIIAFLIVSTIATLFLSHIIIKNNTRPQSKGPMLIISKRLRDTIVDRYVLITFFSILALTLFNNFDVVFVKKYFSSYDAGIYSAWNLFAKIVTYVIGPITMVSYIFFSSKQNKHSHEKILYISLSILLLVSLVIFIFYSFFPLFTIHLLFGTKYEIIAPILFKASIFGALYGVITLINNYFLAKKSYYSLTLMICISLYALALFVVNKSLSGIISVNIGFALIVSCVYIIAYLKTVIYNSSDGKR